jgi:CheY-like chemotaxis protein
VVDDGYHVAHAHALSVGKIEGFEVMGEAHTAGEAELLVEEQSPDLLLLDMYLPDLSGLDLVRRLAAGGRTVPDFLLVTAARDIESVRTAMQLGALYYLVKPFSVAALREQLQAYLSWTEQLLRTSPGARPLDQNLVDNDQCAATDHGACPGDRHEGPRTRWSVRGRRDPRRQPANRPAPPRDPREEAAARHRPRLRLDGAPRAPVPAPSTLRLPDSAEDRRGCAARRSRSEDTVTGSGGRSFAPTGDHGGRHAVRGFGARCAWSQVGVGHPAGVHPQGLVVLDEDDVAARCLEGRKPEACKARMGCTGPSSPLSWLKYA